MYTYLKCDTYMHTSIASNQWTILVKGRVKECDLVNTGLRVTT